MVNGKPHIESDRSFEEEFARTGRLCAELDAATRAFRAVIERMRGDEALLAAAQRRARAIVDLCETIQAKRRARARGRR